MVQSVNIFDEVLADLTPKLRVGATPTILHDKSELFPLPQLKGKYALRTTPISFGAGSWNYWVVEILDLATNSRLGHYVRNYNRIKDTFYPFIQGGKEYALYSKDYAATRVMSLPDCVDLGGEERHKFGFCPTGYFVPQPEDGKWNEASDNPEDLEPSLDGSFGFVCGCVWGDDSSWKIQHLDLSRITEGVIKRDARFGYIEMPDDCDSLKDAIDLRHYDSDSKKVIIHTQAHFWRDKALDTDFSSIAYNAYVENGWKKA